MPSKRYSFVRGRPPLMRGSSDVGGSATPGASDASVMNVRPFSGSWTTCSCATTVPRLPVSARSTGRVGRHGHLLAPRADGQLEVDARRGSGRRGGSPLTPEACEARQLDLDPIQRPGPRPVAPYTPSAVETTIRWRLVSRLVTVMVAPGNGCPAGSRTTR